MKLRYYGALFKTMSHDQGLLILQVRDFSIPIIFLFLFLGKLSATLNNFLRNVMLQCLFIAQKSTMFNFFFTLLCEQNIRSKYTEFSGALFRFYGLRNSQKYMDSSLHSCTSLVDQLPPLLVDGMQTMSK